MVCLEEARPLQPNRPWMAVRDGAVEDRDGDTVESPTSACQSCQVGDVLFFAGDLLADLVQQLRRHGQEKAASLTTPVNKCRVGLMRRHIGEGD